MNPSALKHDISLRRCISGCFRCRKSREKGYSLVEVIVVMGILATLMGLAWSGFYGMRTSMIVIQNMETLRADIVNAQRSAMLLDRGPSETWVYGIGVDLSSLDDASNSYTVFKWCSPDPTYENFPDGEDIPGMELGSCTTSGITPVAGKKDVTFVGGSLDAEFYAENLAGGFEQVDVILFESVTGKVHFYKEDSTGLSTPVADVNWASVNLYKKSIDDRIVVHNEGLVFTHTGSSNPEYCIPDCVGKDCGDNGCDGECGACGYGEICDESGMCSTDCTPECKPTGTGLRPCGPDTCGGSCGDCSFANDDCVDGYCYCEPSCEGRKCGTDGCGKACGECDPPYTCDIVQGLCCDDGECIY